MDIKDVGRSICGPSLDENGVDVTAGALPAVLDPFETAAAFFFFFCISSWRCSSFLI